MKRQKELIELSRIEKIIITLFDLANGKKKNIRFEDLVVALFKKYPDHFHLKGYLEFPDSESVNNALYHNLKKKGLINYGNKAFCLTNRGLETARVLKKSIKGKVLKRVSRLPKFVEEEIERIKSLEGFHLFISDGELKITDSDLYNYLGVSVRTQKNDFLGRLQTITDAIKELKSIENSNIITSKILGYHKFMMGKFKNIIEFKSK